MTMMAVGGMVFSMAAEPIRKCIGRLNSLALVLTLTGTGAVGLVVAPNSAVSITAMFFLGLAMTGILLVGQNILVLIHRARSARMIGEFSVTFSIASLACVLLLPVLAGSVFGWRAYPGLQIVALLVLALPLLVGAYRNKDLIPDHSIIEVATDQPLDQAPAASTASTATTGQHSASQARGLAKHPIALMAVVIALEWSIVFWTALFLIDVAGISAAQGAVATAVLVAGVLAGRLAGSFLLEQQGGWRLLVLSCALALIAVVLVLQAVSMISALLLAAAVMLVWARPRSGQLESVS
ncbi:MFS transporter [Jonesiaceae bacterium BS-20]|uniref:MFS transporter n=1 Tax=Jonesiaceae bacterium BS-20 TaxID=3120821 RepID=A0AAU7DU66_9MICO